MYCYNTLPTRLLIAINVFQEAMGRLFLDMKKVVICLDDIAVLGYRSLTENLVDM